MSDPLVPEDFDVPGGLTTESFVLEPLRAIHNAQDHAAWNSSMDHIRATPGFAGRNWPTEGMSLEDNEGDLRGHEADFLQRTGFTYTVIEPSTRQVIGCVYLYPPRREGFDVDVRSWVTAEHAELDKPLYDRVRLWLSEAWPFVAPDYAPR
jgi:hypothetical protein